MLRFHVLFCIVDNNSAFWVSSNIHLHLENGQSLPVAVPHVVVDVAGLHWPVAVLQVNACVVSPPGKVPLVQVSVCVVPAVVDDCSPAVLAIGVAAQA